MKKVTACFSGHRKIPPEQYEMIARRLKKETIKLIEKGYLYFGAGGALGFDTLAAQTILTLKKDYPQIRLILVLPCLSQADNWNEDDKSIYEETKSKADKVVYTSRDYTRGCMHKRNRHLVDTVTIDNSANSVVAGWGLYVVGYSKARIKATASGSYGSTISSFTISGGYSTTQTATSLDYTGGKLSASGSKTFTVSAKDSRGRSSESKTTDAITVYAYSAPKITAFTVGRSTSNAKQMVVTANWTFASVNNKNSATGILYYKKSTATSWTKYGAISKNTAVTLSNEFLEASSYNFKLVVTDALSESAQDETFVSTVSVLLDFRAGGKGLGIGKIAETDRLEVDMKSVFMQDIYIKTDSGEITLADYILSVVNS